MTRRATDSEAGVGLVELLISVVLLGVGAVAILSSYAGVIKLSKLHKDQTTTTNALSIAAEAISSPVVAYQPCAGADVSVGTYRTAVTQALAQATNDVGVTFAVAYWDGVTFQTGEGNCHDNDGQVPAMDRMQQITLTAVVPTQSNPWSITIIKRAA